MVVESKYLEGGSDYAAIGPSQYREARRFLGVEAVLLHHTGVGTGRRVVPSNRSSYVLQRGSF